MNKKLLSISVVLVLAIVIVLFIVTWQGIWPYPSEVKTLENRGQFGDSFAIFGAVVSALGFLGIVVTLVLQQSQISQQSQELKRQATRDDANRYRDEIAQYEQLLFRLLDYYKESVDSIRLNRQGEEIRGRDSLTFVLKQMQLELKRRKLHFVPERELTPIRKKTATEVQRSLFEYMTVETCRVIQYTVVYQRRVLATLRTLLEHLEHRCPNAAEIETYRSLVASQITHVEIQYIFAIVLIHENEAELRQLLQQSGLLTRSPAPYNFKFHRFLYQYLWGVEVGDPTQARRLAFRPKRSAKIRAMAAKSPLAELLAKYSIGPPVRSESLQPSSPSD